MRTTAALIVCLTVIGCASVPVAEEAREQRATVTQFIANLKAEIATYPEGDPARVFLEKQLASAEKALPGFDAIIDASTAKDVDDPALDRAAAAIPYGG